MKTATNKWLLFYIFGFIFFSAVSKGALRFLELLIVNEDYLS